MSEEVKTYEFDAYQHNCQEKQSHEQFGEVFFDRESEHNGGPHQYHDDITEDVVDFSQIYPRQVGGGHQREGEKEAIFCNFLFHNTWIINNLVVDRQVY